MALATMDNRTLPLPIRQEQREVETPLLTFQVSHCLGEALGAAPWGRGPFLGKTVTPNG